MTVFSFLPTSQFCAINLDSRRPWVSALFLRHQTHYPAPSDFLTIAATALPVSHCGLTFAAESCAGKQHLPQCSSLEEETSKSRVSPLRSSILKAERHRCCVARHPAGTPGFVPPKLPTSSGLRDCLVWGVGIRENTVTTASLHAGFVTSRLTLQLHRVESRFLNNKLNFWPLLWSSGV